MSDRIILGPDGRKYITNEPLLHEDKQAAELRRLHDEHAQLGQALKRAIERINELEALNAELLEALKHAAECVQSNYLPDKMGRDWDDVIAKAEASNGS